MNPITTLLELPGIAGGLAAVGVHRVTSARESEFT